ncbi:MAG: hypothetical protein R2748_23665 [Bryobacterales bacterium]
MTGLALVVTIATAVALAPTVGAAPPVVFEGGVVNSADYSVTIAPGMIVSIFGENLAPGVDVARNVPLPDTLLGVSVEVHDGLGPSERRCSLSHRARSTPNCPMSWHPPQSACGFSRRAAEQRDLERDSGFESVHQNAGRAG